MFVYQNNIYLTISQHKTLLNGSETRDNIATIHPFTYDTFLILGTMGVLKKCSHDFLSPSGRSRLSKMWGFGGFSVGISSLYPNV